MTSRLVCYAALLAMLSTVGSSHNAWAQSADERAAQFNEEGKDLWLKKKDLEGAAGKFRQATTLSPQPQYFFNLCYALHQLGQFAEARTACRAVESNGGDPKLQEKARIVLEDIATRIPDQPTPPDPADPSTDDPGFDDPGTGEPATDDPGTGEPATDDPNAVDTEAGDPDIGDPGADAAGDGAAPPAGPIPGLYQPAQNPDEYKWSAGGDLGLTVTNLTRGYFGHGGLSLRGFINFTGLRNLHAGLQFYGGYTPMDGGAMGQAHHTNVGVALFKDVRVSLGKRKFYVTPLIGAHLSFLFSEKFSAFGALGVRAEATGTWLMGSDRRHAIRAGLAIDYYLPHTNEFNEQEFYSLDRNSVGISLIVGYSLRFTTPFGRASLITLE